MKNDNSVEVHCKVGVRTLFKSKWSGRSATSHMVAGLRFSYETCWTGEGFKYHTYKVIARQDQLHGVVIVAERE